MTLCSSSTFFILLKVATLEAAEQENTEGRKNICLEMKMLHAIHLAVNGTKMGIIQVSDRAMEIYLECTKLRYTVLGMGSHDLVVRVVAWDANGLGFNT